MALDPLTAVLDIGGKIIDKLWPDKAEADRAKLALIQLEQQGQLEELKQRYNAIVAEAQSSDPWTSRARPSFMYVMYTLLLMSIPFGVAWMIWPDRATLVAQGFQQWLNGIPSELYWLFGAGYLGYGTMRTVDKIKGKV